jgi:hypothetical protein
MVTIFDVHLPPFDVGAVLIEVMHFIAVKINQ